MSQSPDFLAGVQAGLAAAVKAAEDAVPGLWDEDTAEDGGRAVLNAVLLIDPPTVQPGGENG